MIPHINASNKKKVLRYLHTNILKAAPSENAFALYPQPGSELQNTRPRTKNDVP